MSKVEGQYTLECDPMVLANRVKALEQACDMLTASLMWSLRSMRLVCRQLDSALCEDRPLQAECISEQAEELERLCGKVHAASTLLNRSY